MSTKVTIYSRDELYTYGEAAQVIGVTLGTVRKAAQNGTLSTVRLQHEMNKFIPKFEVDSIANTGSVTSKEARARLAAVRNKNSGSLDDLAAIEIERAISKALDPRISQFVSELDSFRILFEEFRNSMSAYAQQALPLLERMSSLSGKAPNPRQLEDGRRT